MHEEKLLAVEKGRHEHLRKTDLSLTLRMCFKLFSPCEEPDTTRKKKDEEENYS
jgi:hypothetical protein